MKNNLSEINTYINKLYLSITNDSSEDISTNYIKIYNFQDSATKLLVKKIHSLDFNNLKHLVQIRIISIFLNLLFDINEHEANKIFSEIIKNTCNEIVIKIINSIKRMSGDNFHIYSINDIIFYESKMISKTYKVANNVNKWLSKLPPKDLTSLKRIDRIYIVADDFKNDNYGYFKFKFNYITIRWNTLLSRFNPYYQMKLFLMELTFFHEVGHFILGHNKKDDIDFENEADSYAKDVMQITLLKLFFIILISLPCYPYYKIKFKRHKNKIRQ